MPPAHVTLAQIAKRAKVSVMTVSRSLRRQPGVSVEMAAKIRRIAEAMGYRPNPLVQALMVQLRAGHSTASAEVIGLLLPQSNDAAWGRQEWIRRAIQGATKRAGQAGFRLEIFKWQAAEVSDQRIDQILKARGIRGVVVAPLPDPGMDLRLDWSQYASAAIGASLQQPRLHRVRHHAFHSVQLAVRKLREAGCLRIGLAQSSLSAARAADLWQAGYSEATRDYSDRARRELYFQPVALEENSFIHWVRSSRPDGILLQDHRWVTWLQAAKLRVPQDVAIAHLNCTSDLPDVAGIDQEFEWIGAATVDVVVEQLHLGEHGIPPRPKDVLLEGFWRTGRTVATGSAK